MYYIKKFYPAFSDTNGADHIDFSAYGDWFDRVRTHMYREMDPTLRFHPHGLVVVTTSIQYHFEASVLEELELRTWTSKIGRKSLETTQECWQNGKKCATCQTVLCGFNLEKRVSEPLIDAYRQVALKYFMDRSESAELDNAESERGCGVGAR